MRDAVTWIGFRVVGAINVTLGPWQGTPTSLRLACVQAAPCGQADGRRLGKGGRNLGKRKGKGLGLGSRDVVQPPVFVTAALKRKPKKNLLSPGHVAARRSRR